VQKYLRYPKRSPKVQLRSRTVLQSFYSYYTYYEFTVPQLEVKDVLTGFCLSTRILWNPEHLHDDSILEELAINQRTAAYKDTVAHTSLQFIKKTIYLAEMHVLTVYSYRSWF
jgi:hypothetical protein